MGSPLWLPKGLEKLQDSSYDLLRTLCNCSEMMRDLTEVTEFMRARKKRLTPQRELLLKIIQGQSHLDADKIHRLAKRKDPRLSLSTVYRTLSLLKELELIEELHLGEEHHHYEAKAGERHHYHLICLSCRRVIECPLTEEMKDLGERHGFNVVSAQVELLGYCPTCRKVK